MSVLNAWFLTSDEVLELGDYADSDQRDSHGADNEFEEDQRP